MGVLLCSNKLGGLGARNLSFHAHFLLCKLGVTMPSPAGT